MGERQMAYLMERIIDANWQVVFHWDDPKAYLSHGACRGRSLTRQQVPQHAYFTSRRIALPDFCLLNAWIVISHRVRSRIDELEPALNQYFPFMVARKNGKPVLGPDGEPLHTPYYLMHATTRIDAINLAESGLDLDKLPNGFVFASTVDLATIVLDRKRIEGNHVWEGIRHFAGELMVSDALGDWIIANKMKGVALTRLREG
jgi:hypothetical protein